MKGYDPYKYIDVNITGNLNILEYCRKAKADRILFAQSFGDIKDHAEDNPLLTVDLPRKFSFTSDHTIYVMTKNFAVDMIENYHQMYGLRNFIFRLSTIYLYSPVDTYYVDGNQRKIRYRLLIDKARAGEPIDTCKRYGLCKGFLSDAVPSGICRQKLRLLQCWYWYRNVFVRSDTRNDRGIWDSW